MDVVYNVYTIAVAISGQQPLQIRSFEIDSRNSGHFEARGIDANLLYEVLAGEPLFFVNPPAGNRSGSHLMIGPAASGRFWTIVLVMVDDAGVWRPITGWPSTGKERATWSGGRSQQPKSES